MSSSNSVQADDASLSTHTRIEKHRDTQEHTEERAIKLEGEGQRVGSVRAVLGVLLFFRLHRIHKLCTFAGPVRHPCEIGLSTTSSNLPLSFNACTTCFAVLNFLLH